MKRGTTIPELEEMLTYCRPHGSQTESDFVEKYIGSVPGMTYDKYGNGFLRIGTAPVLWSAIPTPCMPRTEVKLCRGLATNCGSRKRQTGFALARMTVRAYGCCWK